MVASDGTLPGTPIVFKCRKWARSAAQNCAASDLWSVLSPQTLHLDLLPALAHFVGWLLLCTIQHAFQGAESLAEGPLRPRFGRPVCLECQNKGAGASQVNFTSHCRVAISRSCTQGNVGTQSLRVQAH